MVLRVGVLLLGGVPRPSFSLFGPVPHADLRARRHLMSPLRTLVLIVALVFFVEAVAARAVLRSELVHLLRARAVRLLRARVAVVSHIHWIKSLVSYLSSLSLSLYLLPASCSSPLFCLVTVLTLSRMLLLRRGKDGLAELHARADAVHGGLPLLETLLHHHLRGGRSAGARISVRHGDGLRRRDAGRRHVVRLAGRIHAHLRSRRHHGLGSGHELLRRHHGQGHGRRLLLHVLVVIGEVAELVRLGRARLHHALVVLAEWRVRDVRVLGRVLGHVGHVRRLPREAVGSLLQVEGQLVLVGQLGDGVGRVGRRDRGSGEGHPLEVVLVRQVHVRVGLLVVLLLSPRGRRVVRRPQPVVLIPVPALGRQDALDVR